MRSRKYGNMGSHMKMTVELPDELMIEAKKRAAEQRRPLRELLADALRNELGKPTISQRKRPRIRWVTVDGGLPAVDIVAKSKVQCPKSKVLEHTAERSGSKVGTPIRLWTFNFGLWIGFQWSVYSPTTQLNPAGGSVRTKSAGALPFGWDSRVSASQAVIAVGQM